MATIMNGFAQAGDPAIQTADIDVNRMSVRQLKAELAARDVDISHCHDKSELLVLLRKARTAGPWDNGSFARRRSDNSYCWVELVDDHQALCHLGEGSTGVMSADELDPIAAVDFPCPNRFEGTFDAARAEAYNKGKVLVVAVVSGRGKPPKEEAMQYMALASDEVRLMVNENAVFWRGKPAELRETQFRQLAPVEILPSLAVAVPLAADAMTVVLAVPGFITRSQTLDSVLEGVEAMEVHRQVVQARQTNDDAQLRQAQDAEYAEGLAVDQANDAARASAAAAAAANEAPAAPAPQSAPAAAAAPAASAAPPAASSAAAPPAPAEQSAAAAAAEEARRQLAEEFIREGPSPVKADPVRLVLKLPTGERVERTFEAQDRLSRVRRWAQSCPLLPEAEGRQLHIPASFELATAFPRRKFTAAEMESTLRELGLAPSAALLLVEDDA
eukprot:TRINITY_DN17200_c0_g1_i1.p1 TRINITY_DN17200_c0_g1~~TRINITY_DN17200_c0_g1_i1.p1  ORF type:complete len:445 (+),score=120.61 TRINITY_DN17200_c0_g1_i1:81-1415(+)